MIAPGFESHQCLAGMWKRQPGCHAGCQKVGRCCTRGESQGTCNVTHTPPLSSNKAELTLALKPRGDVTRSLKQGYQWPHKKDSSPPKIFKKNKKIGRYLTGNKCYIHIYSLLVLTVGGFRITSHSSFI